MITLTTIKTTPKPDSKYTQDFFIRVLKAGFQMTLSLNIISAGKSKLVIINNIFSLLLYLDRVDSARDGLC